VKQNPLLSLTATKILHLNQPFCMNKSCKPFFGHLEPFSQDREKGEAPDKTVTGFVGRKNVLISPGRLLTPVPAILFFLATPHFF
jgi:hypothetical protein